MNASTLQPSLYEISIVRLPLPLVPLSEAPPKGHSIAPRHANTEAEALAECGKLVKDGYGVDRAKLNSNTNPRPHLCRRPKTLTCSLRLNSA